MTNDEARMTSLPEGSSRPGRFVIRHSSFVIPRQRFASVDSKILSALAAMKPGYSSPDSVG